MPNQPAVGDYSSICFYGEILVSSGTITFKAFVYRTFSQYDHNTPDVYSYTYNSGDTTLLYGTETLTFPGYGTIKFKFMQSGVESPTLINNNKWKVQQYNWAYYGSSKWNYKPAKSCEGDYSHITYYQSMPYLIGGDPFQKVNVKVPYADCMFWNYTGTSIGNEVDLWTTSGTVTPYPTGA